MRPAHCVYRLPFVLVLLAVARSRAARILLTVLFGLKFDLTEPLLELGVEGDALAFQFAKLSPAGHVFFNAFQTLNDCAWHLLDNLDRDCECYVDLDPYDSLSSFPDFII